MKCKSLCWFHDKHNKQIAHRAVRLAWWAGSNVTDRSKSTLQPTRRWKHCWLPWLRLAGYCDLWPFAMCIRLILFLLCAETIKEVGTHTLRRLLLIAFLYCRQWNRVVVFLIVVSLEIRRTHAALIRSFPHSSLLALATYRRTQTLIFFLRCRASTDQQERKCSRRKQNKGEKVKQTETELTFYILVLGWVTVCAGIPHLFPGSYLYSYLCSFVCLDGQFNMRNASLAAFWALAYTIKFCYCSENKFWLIDWLIYHLRM